MAELHRKISNLSSPSSVNRLTSSNSSNITSIPTHSDGIQPHSLQNTGHFGGSVSPCYTHGQRTGYGDEEGDDSDDEINSRPPMLSSYAMSLLEQLSRKACDTSAYNPKPDEVDQLDESKSDSKDQDPLDPLDSSRPSSRRFSSTANQISYSSFPLNRYGSDVHPSESSTHKARQSLRSARSLSKLGLGAPKRLTESELNELAQHTLYQKERQQSITEGDVKGEEGRVTTEKVTTTNVSTTNVFTSMRTTTGPTQFENSVPKGSKHPIVRTPKHERLRPASSCSPKVKRNNNGERSSYGSVLQMNYASKGFSKNDDQVMRTPSRVSGFDDCATPEVARKALTPLSQSKLNREPNEIILFEDVKQEIPSPQRFRNENPFYNSPYVRSVMEERNQRKDSYTDDYRKSQRPTNERRLSCMSYHEPEKISRHEDDRHRHHQSPLLESDSPRKASNVLTINRQDFECLEQIGRGGSSKVYRARAVNGKKDYAIKVVTFDQLDEGAVATFKGEIDILKKLKNEERVVKLIDHSLRNGSLMLVMECGDIDLAHVLANRTNMPFDVNFTRYHAVEMLKCVKAVHDAGIVHSDLKPANFLFVKGTLKLIDFGISNSLSDHTVNIYRECQIGTPNYMAPETLIEVNNTLKGDNINNGTWKVGKPADIWSCGCIIYQMVYGRPPYAGYSGSKRILAITNPKVEVQYPRVTANGAKVNGLLIDTIQRCLKRSPQLRATAEQLLDTDFLRPKIVTHKFINDLVRNAVKYGSTHPNVSEGKLELLVEDVWRKVNEYS